MSNNIVITMAGRGSRFYKAGYNQPKYEIVAHGKSLFEWSMSSLLNFITPDSRIIFVCLKENDSRAFIEENMKSFTRADVHILELDDITDGQATTAWLSKSLWKPDAALLIYNIDTYVEPYALTTQDIKPGSDGWIPCFKAAGDHWSFARTGDNGWVVEVAEKRRVSDLATIGLYWFKSGEQYIESYTRFFSNDLNLVNGERYIAPLYADMITHGGHISVSDLPISAVHVLGTPEELNVFISSQNSK